MDSAKKVDCEIVEDDEDDYKILKNKYLKLKRVKMNVDSVLHEQIKAPLPRKNGFFMIVNGGPGSGKTSFQVNLFKKQRKKDDNHMFYGVFDGVVYVNPSMATITNDMRHRNPFMTIPEDQRFLSLKDNLDDIEELLKSIEGFKCLIIDDCMAELKEKEVQKWLKRLIANRRHIFTSVILASQVFNCIPKAVRTIASHLVLFPTPSTSELDEVKQSFGGNVSKDDWIRITRIAFKKDSDYPFPFLIADRTKYHKVFDRIVLKKK